MLWNKLERNKVYEAIRLNGVDPTECNLTLTDDEAVIAHNSGLVFRIAKTARRSYKITTIVEDGPTLTTTIGGYADVAAYIGRWASDIAAPGLWAEMQRNRELITNIQREGTNNTPFTQDEQKQIAAQLQVITKQLKEQFKLTNEQIERIEEWRHEATETSTRMGRKDWLIYFLGTITALIITATVTAGVGEHIFTMVVQGLIHLFTGGSEPPRILT